MTVNNFLADGGDGFTVLREGTDRLGGAIDLDALAAYLSLPAHEPSRRGRATASPSGRRRLDTQAAGTIHPVTARRSTGDRAQSARAIHRRARPLRADLWGIPQTSIAAGAAWPLARSCNRSHPSPRSRP